MTKIEFDKPLPIGTGIVIDGQHFSLARLEPHNRTDGSPCTLAVWESDCAECGRPFVTRSPSRRLPDGRRCDEHKRPGVRAKAPRP